MKARPTFLDCLTIACLASLFGTGCKDVSGDPPMRTRSENYSGTGVSSGADSGGGNTTSTGSSTDTRSGTVADTGAKTDAGVNAATGIDAAMGIDTATGIDAATGTGSATDTGLTGTDSGTGAVPNPVTVLVWGKKKKSKYKSSISEVVAQGLNKTAGLSATAAIDDQTMLTKEKLVKYRVLFLFHAPGISSSAQSTIVSLVKSGELGLVASHDALRDNKEIMELVGMATMYTDYFDMQEIWSVSAGHPITSGVPEKFELNPGQPYITFTVSPDVNMIFKGRSTKDKDLQVGWTREPEKGRTFYFCPDHETYTAYEDPNVQKLLSNAAFWVAIRSK